MTGRAMTPVERLGLHLGLSSMLLQNGAPMSMIQQQLVGLRGVINDILADEATDPKTIVQLSHLLPESLAEEMVSDVVIPDNLEEL